MYLIKRANDMYMRISEFMLYIYVFVWGDRRGYALHEYMLMSGMLVTGVSVGRRTTAGNTI